MSRNFLDHFISYEDSARRMGGKVHTRSNGVKFIQCPALGHSRADLGVTFEVGRDHPDGLLVNVHNDKGAELANKDHIFEMHGAGPFVPSKGNGKSRPSKAAKPKPDPVLPDSDLDSEEIQLTNIDEMPSTGGAAKGDDRTPIAIFDYVDSSGELLYQKVKYASEPKYRQRRPDGNGGWIWNLGDVKRVLYRLPDLSKFESATVFVPEGEKDSERVAALGLCATTANAGEWKNAALVEPLRRRDVIVLPDFDLPGDTRALEVANAVHNVAASVRMVFLPGLTGARDNKDVTDWLTKHDKAELETVCFRAPLWSPGAFVEGSAEAKLVKTTKKKETDDTSPTAPLKLTYFDECGAFVDKNEILKNLMAIGETSGWIGPPGSGKSALLTEVSIHCVRGIEWRGFKYKSESPLSVLILALERADLYKRRLHAYSLRDKVKGLPIAVAGAVVDLLNPACVEIIVATAREVERKFSRPVGLVILDTYAKGIAASGGDEDKARDQNRAAVHLREIHARIPVHIALVGHTGKDETRGARGSNAHLGDVDLMSQLNNEAEIKVVEITKANDAPMGIIAGFKIELFDLGLDEDGDQRQTSILDSNQYLASKKAKKREPTGKAKAALHSLFETIADGKIVPTPNDPHIPKSVTSGTSLSHWRCDALSRGVLSAEGNSREEFKRIRVTLQNLGLIGVWEDFVWPVT